MKFRRCAIALLAVVILNSCNSKSNDRESSTTPVSPNPIATIVATTAPSSDVSNKTFLASNVLLGLQSVALAQDAATAELDPNTKVRPEQIQLSDDGVATTVGRLKSKNLKDALEIEVSPSLEDTIKDSRWSIVNKGASMDQFLGDNAVGVVRFDGTTSMTLESGGFWAAGYTTQDGVCNAVSSQIKLEILENSLIISAALNSLVLELVSLTRDKIVVLGTGGACANNVRKVSILTRIPST